MRKIHKCACGEKDCKISIHLEDEKHILLTGKSGEESLMYVDANTIVALIADLKEMLLRKTELRGGE